VTLLHFGPVSQSDLIVRKYLLPALPSDHILGRYRNHSLFLSKITYALAAFAGHLTADDRNRINAISREALRRHTAFGIAKIRSKFDRKIARPSPYYALMKHKQNDVCYTSSNQWFPCQTESVGRA